MSQLRLLHGGKQDGVARFDFVAPIHTDAKRRDGVLAKLTPEGFIRAEARIARSGLLQYSDGKDTWTEYRPPEEMFSQATLDSFGLVVVTNDHPDRMVTTDNVRDVAVGHVGGEVKRDKDFARVDVLIWHPDAVKAVQDGKSELSIGFTCDVEAKAGTTPDGKRFDAIQRNLRGNHVAIVDRGRAGPEVRLLLDRFDGGAVHQPARKADTMETLNIGGVEVQVPPEVAELVMTLTKENETLRTAAAKAASEEEAPVPDEKKEPAPQAAPQAGNQASAAPPAPEKKGDSREMLELKAKVDAQEALLKGEQARFDARLRVREGAREVFGPSAKLDGLGNDVLMSAVVVEVLGADMAAKLDAHKDQPGYLEACFERALEANRQDAANHGDVIVAATPNYGADDISQMRDSRIAQQARCQRVEV